MAASIKTVIVDTGYWLALFDARDPLHKQAYTKVCYIESLTVLFPWPTLYETLRTKFVKNQPGINALDRVLKQRNVHIIDDIPYRVDALEETLIKAHRSKRNISLCDMTIRLMIEDVNLRINFILTFNEKDFSDVCRSKKVQIL
jgi:predicted nucleic acid-binding protein